jgi:hypothetical protein
MLALFKAELSRFRGWGITAALVHMVVLGFLVRVDDLAQAPLFIYRFIGGVYALAGLLLGTYQMGSYRRPNAWLNLLHRPLPAWRIAVALFGAGAVWLMVALALPILVVAGYQETMTARVADLRHWLFPLAALLIASCGYLVGGVAMLGNRRWSACGLVFLVWLMVSAATGLAALAVQVLALAWLALLVWATFKPDLAAPPRTALGMVATAVPLQMGAYLLVLLLGLGIEMLWIMQGSHPNNMEVPPHGGHKENEVMSGRQRMLAGLSTSTNAHAPLWREQVRISKVWDVGQQVPWALTRHALTNHEPMQFDDSERRVRWVFSHDRMRYQGYGLVDGRAKGELGADSEDRPFPAPTMLAGEWPEAAAGDAALVAGNTLYHYVSETGHAAPRIRLPAGELLLGATSVGEALVVRSARALYFFDGRDAVADENLMTPRQSLRIPGLPGDLYNIDLIELVDGYLVSFSFTQRPHDLIGAVPQQFMVWLHDNGDAQVVARREIAYDYPPLYRYKAWWPSPALYALRQGAVGFLAGEDPLQATAPPLIPRSMWILAGALMLLSLLCGAWLLRRRALPTPGRVLWLTACGVIGLPALVSLWLLHPERA